MNASVICTRNVITCRVDETVFDAARRMRGHHVGDLVVVDDADGKTIPMGMLTDRDIMLAVVAGEQNASTLKVGDIMSSPAVVTQHLGRRAASGAAHAAARGSQNAGGRREPGADRHHLG